MRKLKILALLSIVLLLSACVSAPKPIDTIKLEENKISNIHLEAANKIQINLRKSSAGSQFGLLGALIDLAVDSHREEKAEQVISDIKNNMSDYDFRSIINEKIPQKLQSKIFIENLNVNIIESGEIPEDDFVISGRYELSDDFSRVNVYLNTSLYGIEETPIRRFYVIISKINGLALKREDNAILLSEDNSARLKSVVSQSVDEALTIINKDFSGEYSYEEDAKKVSFSDGTYSHTGRLLEEINGKVIAGYTRQGKTGIFSIPTKIAASIK